MQNLFTFILAFWLDAMAQHKLWPRFMHSRLVAELCVLHGPLDGPPRENLCYFRDIPLRVAAIDAERVQFEQLAPIVLVQSAVIPAALIRIPARKARPPVRSITHWTRRNALGLHRVRPHTDPVIEV